MSDTPILTVITATFNLVKAERVERFRQCVESVHQQTCPGIEHLIIDGASTDGTLELVQEYVDKGWVQCFSEPDTGIYNAMNKGIARAKGKYIVFLNSDDYWHEPRGVELAIHLLEISRGTFTFAPHDRTKFEKPLGTEYPMLPIFYRGMPFCHQTMITLTETIRELGGFDESLRVSADFDLITQVILSGGKPVYVPFNFTTYRADGFSGQKDTWRELLSDKERVLTRYYGKIIGEEGIRKLMKDEVDPLLFDALEHMVHHTISAEIRDTVKLDDNGVWKVCKARYFKKDEPEPEPVATPSLSAEPAVQPEVKVIPVAEQSKPKEKYTTYIRTLFGLPLMKAERWPEKKTRYKLFNCIPLVQVDYRDGCMPEDEKITCKLFRCIPLWKITKRARYTIKHYLFGFIPVHSVKKID